MIRGFCRIKTKDGVVWFGEITNIEKNHVMFTDFNPNADEIRMAKADIVEYEQVEEDDIPPYE